MKHRNDRDEIERLLIDTAVPRVLPGNHRSRLRAELLNAMNKEQPPMLPIWIRRMAWACLTVLALTATGWAAHKVYTTCITETSQLEMKPVSAPRQEQLRAQGNNIGGKTPAYYITARPAFDVKSDDPMHNPKIGSEQYSEIQKMIAQGKIGRFLRREEGGNPIKVQPPLESGQCNSMNNLGQHKSMYYIYEFTLADGQKVEYRSLKALRDSDEPKVQKYLIGVRKCNGADMLLQTYLTIGEDGRLDTAVKLVVNEPTSPIHEVPDLVAQAKGELVEVKQLSDGRTLYVYKLTLSNGQTVLYGADHPLKKQDATTGTDGLTSQGLAAR